MDQKEINDTITEEEVVEFLKSVNADNTIYMYDLSPEEKDNIHRYYSWANDNNHNHIVQYITYLCRGYDVKTMSYHKSWLDKKNTQSNWINSYIDVIDDQGRNVYDIGLLMGYHACEAGDLIKLEQIYEIDQFESTYAMLRLMECACTYGHKHIMEFLFSKGCPYLNSSDPYEKSYKFYNIREPLYIACEEGHSDIVKYLCAHYESNSNEFNEQYMYYSHLYSSALNVAILKDHIDIAVFLTKKIYQLKEI